MLRGKVFTQEYPGTVLYRMITDQQHWWGVPDIGRQSDDLRLATTPFEKTVYGALARTFPQAHDERVQLSVSIPTATRLYREDELQGPVMYSAQTTFMIQHHSLRVLTTESHAVTGSLNTQALQQVREQGVHTVTSRVRVVVDNGRNGALEYKGVHHPLILPQFTFVKGTRLNGTPEQDFLTEQEALNTLLPGRNGHIPIKKKHEIGTLAEKLFQAVKEVYTTT